MTVLTGEVQQYRAGRWVVVLTAGGIPVDDQRRSPGRPGEPPAAEQVRRARSSYHAWPRPAGGRPNR